MAGRALIEQRPWLLGSLAAAIAFYALRAGHLPGLYLIVLKGLPLALLAVWALLRHAGPGSLMLAGVMALASLGDMVLEIDAQTGAMFFLFAHALAIALFWSHRRETTTPSQKALGICLLIGVPLLAFVIPEDRALALPMVIYGAVLGGMAASAWTSSFPRYRVGLGAMLFVLSNLLIFSELGPDGARTEIGVLDWPLYYCAQLLICTGVIGALRKSADAVAPQAEA